jgi:protein-glutamine gamma-glutamyltransferase
MIDLPRLHRRLLLVLGLSAVIAFMSGAGLDTPLVLPAVAALVIAFVWEPSRKLHERLEWLWRIAAVALAARAIRLIFVLPEDVVLPMVDVLLVLLISEALRPSATTERTRIYSLSFALLIGAAAYRAGVAFGLSFIVYITAGTVALLLGHVIRESRRRGQRPPALTRGFLLRVAALSSVMLFMSGLLFVAFPRVTRNWVTRGTPTVGSIVGFSGRVSLDAHGGRIYPNPEVVLRVEFPEGRPVGQRSLYWRGRSYDYFDGVAWWHSERVGDARVPTRIYRTAWTGEITRQRVFAVPLQVQVLFTLHPLLDLQPQSRMRWGYDSAGDLWYEGGGPPVYQAISKASVPTDDELRAALSTRSRADEAYLQLAELPESIRKLTDSLTAGAATDLDRARVIERWLRTQFRYTLDLPATAREAKLEHFLFQRRAGHCEYFSTAMVVLLRAAGVPARNVNGFLGGDWNEFGNFLTVTQNQAHSWVEVWFPGYGWVPFDPTPSAAGDVAALQPRWFRPLQSVLDGLEHRWNKWILEYNLDTQMGYFKRVADAISRPEPGGGRKMNWPVRRIAPYFFGALLLFVLLRTLKSRGSGRVEQSQETRLYLKLRRACQRHGLGSAESPPLAFVHALGQARSPVAHEAQLLVRLYLESRFGGVDIGETGRAQMREALIEVERLLRAARRAA